MKAVGWLCAAGGWGMAAALGILVLPKAYHRWVVRIPFWERAEWAQLLSARKSQLALLPWRDARPLNVLVGYSHIEYGNWYELFGGACAVRNCGLARAKIRDVTELVRSVPDRHPAVLLLMCGINNLAGEESVEECVREYEDLLQAAAQLEPRKLLVLSVLPMRQSVVDRRAGRLNQKVQDFNRELARLSERHHGEYVDLARAVSSERAGLAETCTVDGLHLNSQGYARVAAALQPHLAPASPIRP